MAFWLVLQPASGVFAVSLVSRTKPPVLLRAGAVARVALPRTSDFKKSALLAPAFPGLIRSVLPVPSEIHDSPAPVSPLAGLLEHAPQAAEQAAQRGLSDAASASEENFLNAAGLRRHGRPAGGVVSALDDDGMLKVVAKELGPLIEEDEAPGLYRALNGVFDRLSAAQKRLFPSDVLALNRVRVIDTPVLNAFVYQNKNPGVRRMSNTVFLTSGIIRKMLSDEQGKPDLKSGMVRLIGILAHELAHPLERVDSEGISQHHGAAAAGQALEIRADAEGARIAREAGFPADSVYRGLTHLFLGQEVSSSGLEAAAGTHPQDDMRLSAQRMLLTLDRYERGKDPAPSRAGVAVSVSDELGGLEKAALYWKFDWPTTPAEAVARMEELESLDRAPAYLEIEFNRLLIAFDRLLARKGEALEEADYEALAALGKFLERKSKLEVMDSVQLRRKMTKDNGSEEFLSYPAHEAALQSVKAYRSPRHTQWAKSRFFTKPYEGYGDLEKTIGRLEGVLPWDIVFSEFGERIASDLNIEMHFHPTIRYVYDSSIAEKRSVEFQVRLAHLFHTKVLPKLSEQDQIAFFASSSHDNYTYVFPQAKRHKKGKPRGLLADRMELLGDPRKAGLAALYRETMASVWEKRGYYGTLEFVLEFENTDWAVIWNVLGIDPQVGASQMRQAVKKYTLSPDYARLLRVIKDSKADGMRFAQRSMGVSKFEAMPWADGTLAPFLSGDLNEKVREDQELWDLARGSFAGSYYGTHEKTFRRRYQARLNKFFGEGEAGPALKRIAQAHAAAMKDLLGSSRRSQGFLRDIHARFVGGLNIPEEEKRQVLEALFLKGYDSKEAVRSFTDEHPAGRWIPAERGGGAAILKALQEHGVVEDAQDLLERLQEDEEYSKHLEGSGYSDHFRAVKALGAELLAGLRARLAGARAPRERAAILEGFARNILDPGLGRYADTESLQSRTLRELKRFVADAAGADLSGEAAFRMFNSLTGTGAAKAADDFFDKNLVSRFRERLSAKTYQELDRILRERRIHSPAMQLSLARRLLEPQVSSLKSKPSHPAAIHRLIETLNLYAPQGSMRKDEFLETLAWELGLAGPELHSLIEDEKSYNWKKANPLLVRIGSGLSVEIAKLTPAARHRFIEFLISPEGRELPPEVFKEMENNLLRAAMMKARVEKSYSSQSEIRREVDEAADRFKTQIETALADASPFERIPLFELLLSAGRDGLALAGDFPRNLSRRYLGYAEGSNEEKMLTAFLRVVPEHERTVSMAYLLSQAGGDKSSVKNLFEVFQTVGIKFGQFSSTWRIFGDKIAEETKSLKSSARPMTKAEILEVAARELSPQEFRSIKRFKKILGSASLKTVVLIELTDGREAVMLVQRPRAAEQIEANLSLAAAFLKELEIEGVKVTAAMFDSIMGAVRAQLAEEIKMSAEAGKFRRAKTLFEGLNAAWGARLEGWRFNVPALMPEFQVRDNILFLEKASGVTFDRLDPASRQKPGRWIVESSLRLLLREGWFDADRHLGNQLIDAGSKTIYPLDFGQATEFSRAPFWSSDDRLILARFIRAMEENDVPGAIRFGSAMAAAGSTPREPEKLRERVAETLKNSNSQADRLIGLVNAFADHGLTLEGRFSFGALKGLMTLYGEGYVSESEFREILAAEITRLHKAKLPVLLGEKIFRR